LHLVAGRWAQLPDAGGHYHFHQFETSVTERELEDNIQRKDLTPAELSKEMVRKAERVAPAISTVSVEKNPQGRKRTYAAPKVDVAQAIGVSTGALVNAEQHVAAMERYLVLGGPEVSQKQALAMAKVLDLLPAGEEWWPNARRNPLSPPPPKDPKDPGYFLSFQSFIDCGGVIFWIFWGRSGHACPCTTLVLFAVRKQLLHVTIVVP
jgi:hypothetical protein